MDARRAYGSGERAHSGQKRRRACRHRHALQHIRPSQRHGGQGGRGKAACGSFRIRLSGDAGQNLRPDVRSHRRARRDEGTARRAVCVGAFGHLLRRGQSALLSVRGLYDASAGLYGIRRQRADGTGSVLRQISCGHGRYDTHRHRPRGQGAGRRRKLLRPRRCGYGRGDHAGRHDTAHSGGRAAHGGGEVQPQGGGVRGDELPHGGYTRACGVSFFRPQRRAPRRPRKAVRLFQELGGVIRVRTGVHIQDTHRRGGARYGQRKRDGQILLFGDAGGRRAEDTLLEGKGTRLDKFRGRSGAELQLRVYGQRAGDGHGRVLRLSFLFRARG